MNQPLAEHRKKLLVNNDISSFSNILSTPIEYLVKIEREYMLTSTPFIPISIRIGLKSYKFDRPFEKKEIGGCHLELKDTIYLVDQNPCVKRSWIYLYPRVDYKNDADFIQLHFYRDLIKSKEEKIQTIRKDFLETFLYENKEKVIKVNSFLISSSPAFLNYFGKNIKIHNTLQRTNLVQELL